MNKFELPDSDLEAIQKESERLLSNFKSPLTPNATIGEKVIPILIEPDIQAAASSEHSKINPIIVSIFIVFVGGPLLIILILALQNSNLPRFQAQKDSLGFASRCGSSSSQTGRWWPVLGDGNQYLLDKVRSQFCADAFINNEGALQIASFASWQEAEDFRLRLESATNETFRVGEGRIP
jgi:hypothetical protein